MLDSALRERQARRPDGPLRLRFAEKQLLLGSFAKRNFNSRSRRSACFSLDSAFSLPLDSESDGLFLTSQASSTKP